MRNKTYASSRAHNWTLFVTIFLFGWLLSARGASISEYDYQRNVCDTDQFQCDTNRCVPDNWVCDEDKDCKDGTDEDPQNCKKSTPPPVCSSSQFTCKVSRNCINQINICDGDDDCGDGSDEDRTPGGVCEHIVCRTDQFQCDTNSCVPNIWVCDGEKDCDDGTDEDPQHCKKTTCSSSQFTCKVSGRCIPLAWKCDSDADCGRGDNSDENGDCKYPQCAVTEFKCDNNNCVPNDYYCNGHDDCRDNSDEKGCTKMCDPKTMISCAPHQACFPLKNKCDGVVDCPNGSDEANCTVVAGKTPTTSHNNSHHHSKEERMCEPDHEFQCLNKDCIRKEFRCNLRVDCLDGSDEENCPPVSSPTAAPDQATSVTTEHGLATCEKPMRRCNNATRCITPDRLCDGRDDCEDGSDEGMRCEEKLCSRFLDCSHMCHNAPEGRVCSCPAGLLLGEDGRACVSSHPCRRWGACSQVCQELKMRHNCVCLAGYRLADDGFTCKSMDHAIPYVIFSNRHELRSIDLQSMQAKALISSLNNTIALDFYYTPEANMVFWTDIDKIYRGTMIGGSLSNIEVVVQTGLATAGGPVVQTGLATKEGLAVDWIAQNLYWVESNLDQIEVSRLNGSFRRTLVAGDMDRPRAISVDPRDGLVFWTDWEISSPRIERCTLAGNSRRVVVRVDRVSKGAWPNGITLDYTARRIYWVDARSDSIQTTTYDGTDYHEVLLGHKALSHPFGVALFENHVYWTDWHSKSLIRANKWNGSDVYILHAYTHTQRTYTQLLLDITIMHPSRQPRDGVNPCGDNNGGCSHLCLLDGPKTFQCACPHAMWLAPDRRNCVDGVNPCGDNNGGCSHLCLLDGPKSFQCACPHVMRLAPDRRNCVENPQCAVTEFKCDNNNCVPNDYYCNGHDDCRDNSDEKGCTNMCDPKTMISCAPHQACFPLKNKCDGVVDCPNGSDEANCTVVADKTPTTSHNNSHNHSKEERMCELDHEFQCLNKDCIRKEFRCNLRVDCLDGSDEENCPAVSSPTAAPDQVTSVTTEHALATCEKPMRHCDNATRCITPDRLCDGRDDCEDGSDEGIRCDEKLCSRFLDCSHMCHNAPEGRVCSCPAGLLLGEDGRTCVSSHPCRRWGACSQVCQELKMRHKCVCLAGYSLADDGFTCKSMDHAIPYVIFSNRHELHGIDLQSMQAKALISSLNNTIALDFYYTPEANMVFWTDVIDDMIYRGTMIGGSLSNIEVVVQTGLATAEGLAVDWIAQNLYWVESNLDQIEVSRLNGSFRRTLVAGDMDRPRAISVDPRDGLVFWTDWEVSSPRIERCTLAGNSRQVVVRVSEGAWLNGITLDYTARRIYWVDARSDSIQTTTYDGTDYHEVLRGHTALLHPFAVALFENHVYWTDWHSKSLIRANKWNGSDVYILHTYTQLLDITIMHPSRQPRDGVNPCGDNNGGCSHLCLLDGPMTFQCACPHVMRLAPDRRNCIINEKVLLISRPNELRGVDLTLPYYHTIPTIGQPQVLTPSQLDFVASTNTIYWADTEINEIKKTGLTAGPTQSIIDTGIENPSGFAVDWISGLMFFSSSGRREHISVCNLRGEYTAVVVSGKDLKNVTGLAVDPSRGKLYWAHMKDSLYAIEKSNMDGSDREILVSQNTSKDLSMPQSLSMDFESIRLYWVNKHSSTIQYYDFSDKKVFTVPIPKESEPTAVVPYFGRLYYASGNDQAIHICDKTFCNDDQVLRNNTPNVLSIKIYDAALQRGNNSCSGGRGGCQQLCLPTGPDTRSCACATGHRIDLANPNHCIDGTVTFKHAQTDDPAANENRLRDIRKEEKTIEIEERRLKLEEIKVMMEGQIEERKIEIDERKLKLEEQKAILENQSEERKLEIDEMQMKLVEQKFMLEVQIEARKLEIDEKRLRLEEQKALLEEEKKSL